MNLKRRENLHEFDLFDILRALQEALHHLWPSKSHVCSSRGQKVAKKSEEMKEKSLAFGSLERKFDWFPVTFWQLSVAFFTSWVPYKMPYTILDLLKVLSGLQEVAKKPDKMKKKPRAFGSLERKYDWLSVAFFTSWVPYKMPYIILDLLTALSVV